MKYYIIENEINTKGYRYIILPNNRHQPLGVSPWYSTIDECEKAKRSFAFLVLHNDINNSDSKYVEIERYIENKTFPNGHISSRPKYKFYYYDDNKELLFYREIGFEEKYNCLKCLNSIYKAIVENYSQI